MFFPIHRSGCCVCVCLNSVTGCGCYLEAALDMKSKFGLFMFVLLFGWSKIIIWVLSDEFFEYLVFYGGSDERWENNSDWKNMGQRVFFLVVVIGVLLNYSYFD